jgi:regulation of enolase protein 1 (concanavalin A-like superfamily)
MVHALAVPRASARLRRICSVLAVLLASLTLTRLPGTTLQGRQSPACDPAASNAIVCENKLTGSPQTEWDIAGAGDDQIQGFATDISVNRGQTVFFKIKSSTTYSLDIYRMGYYGGAGARKVATIGSSATTAPSQPACISDTTTGLVDCGNWATTASWLVPSTAVSGIYFAKATRTGGGSSHIVFIVRDDDGRSNLLFQTSDTTWQAYNQYGGNSLYVGSPAGRAYKVSYNRPFTTRGTSSEDWVFNSEYPMVRWLEANGYDVSYFTGVDSDRRGAEMLEHKAFLSVGHDEYWSGGQRSNVERARGAGVHLAFFSGNEIFWKTRWENSIDTSSTPYRTLVSYKETHANAKIDPATNIWTGTWRDARFSPPADGGRPENALSGTIFMVNAGTTAIRVPAAEGRLRFWRNTDVAALASNGVATLSPRTLGYEWDEDRDNGFRPPGLMRLSDTTVPGVQYLQDNGTNYASGTANHALTLYRHASGALVFGAGTIQWPWGLDTEHDNGSASDETTLAMKQATVNLLADMGAQPATLAAGLVTGAASTDNVAPSSRITSPAPGGSVPANSTVTISGSAADAGGGVVGGVEVSVDGGATWRRATGREAWTFSWTTGAARTVTIVSRAADDSGNIEQPAGAITVTVSGGSTTCPCSIWSPAQSPAVPATNDSQSVEVGTRFRSDQSGFITAIRFYKGTQNVGPFVGNLWTESGTLLGSATFSNVSTTGWQEATLATPVSITANTNYVVSYHTNSGFYAGDTGYFATAGVDNGPLHALADTTGAPNGVFKYGASGFPNQTFSSFNYWVDVVFATSVGPDTTPPQVSSVVPASGATGVSPTAVITALFNENVNSATVTSSTFQLRDASNNAVPGSVTYSSGSRTATFTPSEALGFSKTYTATVRGGSTGVKDLAGNALATDKVWSFTTGAAPPPPPDDGPGGPILVVSSSGNPFSRYYAEILRNEGLNAFTATDIGNVTAASLASYDVVVLGEMSLTAGQVTMFSDWVTAGGNLIAMRPDGKLASLLGLTAAGTTLSNAYLLVNTSAAPGSGIVSQTMQFHGTADRYSLSSASTIATLYSSATAATSNPAVTMRSVGSAGGQAAAFTYDLARSVVYTRQGNPAWSGQERDGVTPIRSDDLFFGGSQPDWVDLSKVAIPQADEQQRLLANMINFMNRDRKPLPRFWYLPRGLKAAVVMTGDDHGTNGTEGRFNIYTADSPNGCSVSDWECVRSTSYIYPSTPITPAAAAGFVSNGFEIGVHVTTNCGDYTPQSLETNYAGDLAAFAQAFPGLPAPRTNRTHCIAWSDYDTQPQVALSHGIRFDTNYYYWPDTWIRDVPGLFTGSGMPMRFAKADGTMINVYQATTQMTDESGQSYPLNIDTLLNRALGTEGYYGVFTANMHTDTAAHAGSDAIVSSAQSRNVPIVSSKQMLDWLDGRNASSFGNLTWSANSLGFTIVVGTGANGLQALVPATSSTGNVTGITRNGSAVTFTTQTLKGVSYAVFNGAAGTYKVSYGTDTTAPVIGSVAATSTDVSATITWTTDESATSRVDYGTSATSLTSSASSPGSGTAHSVALTGLTPSTQYFYRVTSADASGNAASAPATAATFTTRAGQTGGGQTVRDTTAADFASATPAAGVYVSQTGDGELILTPTVGAEFSGAALPSGWSTTPWSSGGATTVSGGQAVVDGARAQADALFDAGASLEFVATFGSDNFQHAGFGVALDAAPWAIFSTASGGGLYARTNSGAAPTDTLLPGNWLNAPHRYRIDWGSSSVAFFIDGTLVATHSVAINVQMRPIASDATVGGAAISLDWMRMTPYASTGTFTSRVLDAGSATGWVQANWTAVTPAGTSVALSARFGNSATPDATWTAFSPLASSPASVSQTSRYVQYRAVLASSTAAQTPVLQDVTFTSSAAGTLPSITIADRAVTEGNAGTANAVLTLSLSAASSSAVTVNYATAAGTATAGSDYTTASGTATFAAGTTSTTIAVPIVGDTIVEPDETVLVNLTSPANATIGDPQAILTITNDDTGALPSITIADRSIAEGNAGTTNAVLTLTLSAASTSVVTVNYATAAGTATAGSDYTTASGTATFAAGTTSTTIAVPIVGDAIVEPDETVLVNLTSPANATIGDPQAILTITNDDAAAGLPSITIADRSIAEGNAGTTNAVVTLTLSAASASVVTVGYATAAGTATAGTDYTTTSGTATFAAGATSTTISIPIVGDTTVEPNETVLVNLTSPVNATIADAQAVVTITNDDTAPLPSPWQTQDIGAVGLTGSASFASGTDTYSVTGAGADIWGTADAFRYVYQPLTGDGQIVARVATVQNTNVWVKAGVMIRGDLTAGSAQAMMMVTPGKGNNFQRRLVAGGASTGTAGAVVTAPYWVRLVRIGNTITASQSADGATWSTVGTDTFTLPGTVFVGLAVSSHSTTTLATATFDQVAISTATVPSITIADRAVAEGNSGTVNAVLTLTLSAPSSNTVSVGYATAAGTATAGTDYTTTSGTATFAAGATSTTITVPIVGDTTVEPDETVLVNLSSPVNATIADPQAVVMITNDDTTALPSITIADRSIAEGNAGTTNAVVTLTLSAASTSVVTVGYSTAAGTATAETDYTTTSGTATFAAGATSTTISIPIVGDTTVEPNETVLVNLTSPVNATIADAQAAVTITNDDAAPLPSPWQTQDIGAVGLTGSASFASGTNTYSVTGAGADIWGTADAFRYVYQPLTGDGQIVARVATVQNTNVWVKAGVMIRGDLTAGSAQAMMMVTPGKGNNFQRRRVAGGPSTGTAGAVVTAPYWVRLVRIGNTITASQSADGATWSTVGTDTFTLPGTVFVGLAVSSHSTTTLATATFDQVAISTATVPSITIADRAVTEGNSGTVNAVLTLTLSAPSSNTVSAGYATAAGTATAGTDYTTVSGTATFAAGATSTTVTVPVVGDTTVEPNETVLVNLTSPVNAMIADSQAVLTITNDDSTAGALPSPWQTQDIGAVGLTGSASFTSGTNTFSVTGAGADIWGTADAFRYVYQPLTGDGQIVARVATVQNTNVWVKAGVMIRGDLTAGSAQAMMMVTPGKGNNFQRRLVAGGTSTSTAGAVVTAPYWVRLVRTGNTITASQSVDGVTWSTVGTDTLTLPGTVFVGLAVSSHSTSTLATATFDQVAFTHP